MAGQFLRTEVQIFVEHWGDNLQFYPIFNIGGVEPRPRKNKRSSPKMEHFFSPNSSGDLRSDAHQSQIITDEDHTQIIGGGYSEIIGGDIYPRVSAPLPPQKLCNCAIQPLQQMTKFVENQCSPCPSLKACLLLLLFCFHFHSIKNGSCLFLSSSKVTRFLS